MNVKVFNLKKYCKLYLAYNGIYKAGNKKDPKGLVEVSVV